MISIIANIASDEDIKALFIQEVLICLIRKDDSLAVTCKGYII